MAKQATPIPDRIRASVKVTEAGCWEWQKFRQYGYGKMHIGSWTDGTRRVLPAHRVSYETFVGPIPEGFHVDHLCNNPPCCNPDHLEAVTPAMNARRRVAHQLGFEICSKGHEQTARTTHYRRGRKECRVCALAAGEL